MITERQLYQTFENIKPHIDAISRSISSYGLGAVIIEFNKGCTEMHVFNDISNEENQILTVRYTPPVEERVEITQGRVPK